MRLVQVGDFHGLKKSIYLTTLLFPAFSDIDNELKSLRLQLKLMFLQLQFERYRREVHAERNRRLAGKSRSIKALDEHNLALVILFAVYTIYSHLLCCISERAD